MIILLLLIAYSSFPATREVDMPDPGFIFPLGDHDRSTEIDHFVRAGMQAVEGFFGEPFLDTVTINVCANRAEFDVLLPHEWGIAPTQGWMVAVGVSDRLILLSPDAWREEAVEHDPDDEEHIQEIITHELVHVYHGQRNPTGDFTGAEELGWFIEGLAVHVSGQLAGEHNNDALYAISAGFAPTELSEAWSGRYRYGVCGSIVSFMEQRYGIASLLGMLQATSQDEILDITGMKEEELLESWQEFIME